MPVLIIPTLGGLHLLQPRYNAITLLELTQEYAPEEVWLASYSAEGLRAGTWRGENEVGLFFTLPWAGRAGVRVLGACDRAEALRGEADKFWAYLSTMSQGKTYLDQRQRIDRVLEQVFTQPLVPEMVGRESFLGALQTHLSEFERIFEEGPATGFRRLRMHQVAQRAASRRTVIWVDALDFPALYELLPGAELPGVHQPGAAERERAVLDRAWRLEEGDDWAALLRQLEEIGSPEARFLAAQVYLAAGRLDDSLSLMDELSHLDFQEPAYLPGYVLARLGQLKDLTGDREHALRAYQAVLALSWAPAEAREAAAAGLHSPFSKSFPDD